MRFLAVLAYFCLLASCAHAKPELLAGTYHGKASGRHPGDLHSLQLTIKSQNHHYVISGSAAFSDGHGVTPDFEGTCREVKNGRYEFTFSDNFDNKGSAILTPGASGIELAIDIIHVRKPQCLLLYVPVQLKKK